jgi:hypothetical protein
MPLATTLWYRTLRCHLVVFSVSKAERSSSLRDVSRSQLTFKTVATRIFLVYL